MKNSKSVMKIFYFINHRTIQKDLSSGKFLDDSIVVFTMKTAKAEAEDNVVITRGK